ncbi:unnamed protein product, partial [Hymenolepis diminuta]
FFHLINNAHLSVAGSYASCSSPLFLNTLPSLSLSLTRFKPVVASLNTFWFNQLLVFCSTIVVSSYLYAYELVTVATFVSC